MKRKIFIVLISIMVIFVLVACGSDEQVTLLEPNSQVSENPREKSKELEGEIDVIRWVKGMSGNAMLSLARAHGYLDEYGIKVEEIPMATVNDSFAALSSNKVDIISNAGTGTPLQYIASGEDVAIFGGHMVSGSVKLIGPAGITFNGVEDLIGKTVGGTGVQAYQYSGPLLDMGYDPDKDVDWVSMGPADTIAAVVKGEVDYGSVGTSMTQKVYEMEKQGLLKVLADGNELVPNYSCCRMETNGKFIKDNPETVKRLLKALIRGQKDFANNPEEAVELIANELDSPKDFIEAYMYDPGYIIHVDPLYNTCIKAWDWFDKMGLLDESAKNIDLKESIRVDIYKDALDEVITEVGDEDPEYWEGILKYFKENNSMYYE